MNPFKLFLAGIFLFNLCACDNNPVFEQNRKIPGETWDAENKLIFETEIRDTVSLYDLYIIIRNEGDFKYSNLFVFVDVFTPAGRIERDTIECILADAQGRWLGKSGSGSLWYNQILFNRKTRFPGEGKYVFRFEQAMREKELENIMDVGLRIEKTK